MKSLQKLALLTAIVAACGGPSTGDGGADAEGGTTPDVITRPDVMGDRVTPPVDVEVPDVEVPDVEVPDVEVPDADMPDTMTMPEAGPGPEAGPDDGGVVLPDVTCPMGQTACGMTCVDTQNSNSNCGACGTVCGMGQTCTAGVCACPMGQTSCGGACVDTQTDGTNCGACGTACPMGQSCTAGVCRIPCAAPRTICGAGAMMACVDTQSDSTNCGTCGTACPMGQSCTAGACACPMGQMACGGACVNTQTDNANCGACGRACGAGQSCTAGVCACPMGQTVCPPGGGAMSTCRNLQTDNTNCGACGMACAAGRVCAMGTCQVSCAGTTPNMCGAGAMAFCTNFQTDRNNCGSCGNACGANANCTAGACRPTNDTPATAVVLPYEVNNRRTVTSSTVNATNDAGSCAGSTNTVYYRIDVLTRSIVYVETFGSTTNTFVGFRTTTAGPSAGCNDNACATMQSQAATIANVGALYIEVGTAMGAPGAVTFRYTIQPAGGGDATAITPVATPTTTTGTTAGGTNGVAQSCGSMTSAPEDAFYFFTCPADPAREFHASSCGSAYDTLIETRSVGVPVTCNDDANLECGLGSSSSANIPAGSGLHVVYVDGFNSGSSGAYQLQYSLGGCNDGFTLCGGNCVQYSTFNADRTNCGACGNVCPGALTCTNSGCGTVSANTFPTVQQPVTQTAFVGGAGGVLNTDNCPVGQTLVGINATTDPATNTLRSIQGVCGTVALGGAPARISFTAGATLATRGTPAGTAQLRRCPQGYALTGITGRAGVLVDRLQLQCSRVNVAGTGPYTVTVAGPAIPALFIGGLGGAAFAPVNCPANQVVQGLAIRAGMGVDAVALRCEALRVFRANVSTTTTALPVVGVTNAMSMSFSDNCPAGQILAGASVRTTGAGINQLAIVCRPYNGLTGTGAWQYSSGADTTGTLRGTAMGGSMTANSICANGAAVGGGFIQNNVTGTHIGRLIFTCSRLGSDVAGTATYTNPGNSALVGPAGAGAFNPNQCATGSLATGLEIRATANIQQIGMRCTPVTSL